MQAEQMQYLIGTVSHVVMVVVLVLVLLGILTWLGIVRCSIIPGWCDVYYSILGQPTVLIVHGDDGMGDPEALREALGNPRGPNIRAKVAYLGNIGLENLKSYDLVIVEKSKTMSTKSLRDLTLFADAGGRLIWTGDAGTVLAPGDLYLYEDELYGKDSNHSIISAWARKYKDKQSGEMIIVNLENYISVRYHGRYCELTSCLEKQALSGWMVPAEGSTDHPLVYGMQPRLPFYGDFAVVSASGGVGTKRILNIDTATELKADGESFGRVVPLIVTSGIGEKIAYYAFPIEQLAEMKYSTLLENMYYGMTE